MAVLDGSTYLSRASALAGVASSKLMLLSLWFQCDAAEGGNILVGGAGAQTYISLDISTSTGFLTFTLTNSAGTDIWGVTSDTDYADGSRHHLGVSVDLGNSRTQFYVDGSSATVTTNTAAADDTIAFASATSWNVAAGLSAASPFTGYLWDVEFWPGISIDLTDSDSINLIVAVDTLQGLGTTPSGVKPVGTGIQGEYLGQPASILVNAFFENRGDGGAFTLTGYPDEDAYPDGPTAWRLFPRWRTPGVRWFQSDQSATPYPRDEMVVDDREGLSTFGQLIGVEELDAPTRQEVPGRDLSDLILGGVEEENLYEPRR